MNPAKITEMLSELRALPYFPSDEYAMAALVRMVGSMATSESQVRWLVSRMTSGIYAQWSGPQEMRACFCGKFKPADGINAYSTVYPDGIPSEAATRPQIARAAPKLLSGGDGGGTANKATEAAVQIAQGIMAAKSTAMRGPATKAEIAAAPAWLRELEGYGE